MCTKRSHKQMETNMVSCPGLWIWCICTINPFDNNITYSGIHDIAIGEEKKKELKVQMLRIVQMVKQPLRLSPHTILKLQTF